MAGLEGGRMDLVAYKPALRDKDRRASFESTTRAPEDSTSEICILADCPRNCGLSYERESG